MKYYTEMFKRALDFRGKTQRQNFWITIMINLLFSLCAGLIALPVVLEFRVFITVFTSLVSLYEVVVFIPTLSLVFRRLHDAGYAGWVVTLLILPVIGWIAVIFFLCQPSIIDAKVDNKIYQYQASSNLENQLTLEDSYTNSQVNSKFKNDEITILKNKSEEKTFENKNENLKVDAHSNITIQSKDEKLSDIKILQQDNLKLQDESAQKNQNIKIEDNLNLSKSKSTKITSKIKTSQNNEKNVKTENSVPQTRSQKVKLLQEARDSGQISDEEYRSEVLKILK